MSSIRGARHNATASARFQGQTVHGLNAQDERSPRRYRIEFIGETGRVLEPTSTNPATCTVQGRRALCPCLDQGFERPQGLDSAGRLRPSNRRIHAYGAMVPEALRLE